MGKIQGFWFSIYGLPSEEVDRQGRKRGGLGLLWLNGLPSHRFRFTQSMGALVAVKLTR
ncbi:hypothetical protein NC653_039699 [Populus alba x Populus x berolinensis]|uniref:Uncharacterized protein n=1 Tax=Populus alba x Populus x berolinensis TaxID=444605 RepID=A0AAD6PQX5_9ROSI|nr:hypothetical protein NC653_039699 [Populus alba x Populus x berolinensis]